MIHITYPLDFLYRSTAMVYSLVLPSKWSFFCLVHGPYFSVLPRQPCPGFTCFELVFVPFCLYLCLRFGCFMEFECSMNIEEAEEFNIMISFNMQTVWSMLSYLSTTSLLFSWKLITCLLSKFNFPWNGNHAISFSTWTKITFPPRLREFHKLVDICFA